MWGQCGASSGVCEGGGLGEARRWGGCGGAKEPATCSRMQGSAISGSMRGTHGDMGRACSEHAQSVAMRKPLYRLLPPCAYFSRYSGAIVSLVTISTRLPGMCFLRSSGLAMASCSRPLPMYIG